jgi:hypothetical protein
MKNKKKRKAKMSKRKDNKVFHAAVINKHETNNFLIYTVLFLAIFILADFFTIIFFSRKGLSWEKQGESGRVIAGAVALPYTDPGFEKMKNLPQGGTFEKKLPVVNDLKFIMSDEPVFAGKDPVYSINVCCLAGVSKDFYTAKMPWALIMYDFEPGLPTITLFELNSGKKQGRFEIVVLDPKADMEKLKAVSVRIFTELVKEYKPGYEWEASVRQEIN